MVDLMGKVTVGGQVSYFNKYLMGRDGCIGLH